jgi:hypothetical protein
LVAAAVAVAVIKATVAVAVADFLRVTLFLTRLLIRSRLALAVQQAQPQEGQMVKPLA